MHLIGGKSIQAAAERVQLNQIKVVSLRDHFRRVIQARMVHPLVVNAQVTLEFAQMGNGVFRKHRQTKTRDKLGDGVVDLAVVVVRTARQNNAMPTCFLKPAQAFLALRAHGIFEAQVLFPRSVHGCANLFFCGEVAGCGLRHFRARCRGALTQRFLQLALCTELLEQAQLQRLFVVVRQEWIHERDARFPQVIHVKLQRLGIAHDNGAVIVVVRAVVFLALPANARHPNEVDVAAQQIHDVTVRQLGRIAHAFGRHGFNARLIRFL